MGKAAFIQEDNRDELRQKIYAAMQDAMERGWRATTIGYALNQDLSLVHKMSSPTWRFRLPTLLTIHSKLGQIKGPPPLSVKAERLLAT